MNLLAEEEGAENLSVKKSSWGTHKGRCTNRAITGKKNKGKKG